MEMFPPHQALKTRLVNSEYTQNHANERIVERVCVINSHAHAYINENVFIYFIILFSQFCFHLITITSHTVFIL